MNKNYDADSIEDLEVEDQEDISIPYDVSKIDILFEPEYVDRLVKRYDEGSLNLNPDFQRNEVWGAKQKSRLIESILIKIPIPSFYIDARDELNWIVIDGLQRLSTIIRYVHNEYPLKDLEFLQELEGKTFEQLERKYQRRIEDFKLSLYLIRPNTPEEIALNIFTRINTLGEPLSSQEIRHAIYNGKSTKLLKYLSESDEFINVVNPSDYMKKRMGERELILRLLAFKITSVTDYKTNNLSMFLANTMKTINNLSDREINDIVVFFKESMIANKEVFSESAFRKITNYATSRKKPINKSLFEIFGVLLPNYDLNDLKNSKELIVQNLKNSLSNDGMFENSISRATNNVEHVNYRFNKAKEIIESAIRGETLCENFL